jgi:prepilin-type N-terminal cleavage/methylation domain-containing protein
MTRNHTRGFTLIEILVVIGVLTILAGLLLPVLAQARDTARRTRCLSSLRQLALAHQAYVQDNDEALPFWEIYTPRGVQLWTAFLRPYYGDRRLLDQGFTSSAERVQAGWAADYVMCAWGSGGSNTAQSPYWRWPGPLSGDPANPSPMLLAEVKRPAVTLQFIDGQTTTAGSTTFNYHANGVRNGVFLDGHAHGISAADWNGIRQDDLGYFYWMAAADR